MHAGEDKFHDSDGIRCFEVVVPFAERVWKVGAHVSSPLVDVLEASIVEFVSSVQLPRVRVDYGDFASGNNVRPPL